VNKWAVDAVCLKKLDLTKFETEKSDCRFQTFRLVGCGVISSKIETITIKGNLLRFWMKYPLSFLKIFAHFPS